jgi:hypothetical protein
MSRGHRARKGPISVARGGKRSEFLFTDLYLSIQTMDKSTKKRTIIRYKHVPCPKCLATSAFPFTNDGGSILICQKCKTVYPAVPVTEVINEHVSVNLDLWGKFTNAFSGFATLEDMNK